MRVDAQRVLRRRREERRALLERASDFAKALPPDLDICAVVVFGSVARGDFNKWSDVDVLVVARGAVGGPTDRHDALGIVPGRVQPVVWTPGEFRRRQRRSDPIAREALEHGRWLRGSPEDFAVPR